MDLIDALRTLDPANDTHWTDGQPSLDVLTEMVGRPVTAEDLSALALDLARPAPGGQLPLPAPEADEDAAEGVDGTSESQDDPDEGDDETEKSQDDAEPELPPHERVVDEEEAHKAFQARIKEMEARKAEIQAEIDEAEAEVARVVARRDELQRQMDAVIEEYEADDVPHHIRTQVALRRLRQASHQRAVEAHARRRAALAGIDPKDLDARAAIDKAMAAKRGRGKDRPTRPLMNQRPS